MVGPAPPYIFEAASVRVHSWLFSSIILGKTTLIFEHRLLDELEIVDFEIKFCYYRT